MRKTVFEEMQIFQSISMVEIQVRICEYIHVLYTVYIYLSIKVKAKVTAPIFWLRSLLRHRKSLVLVP